MIFVNRGQWIWKLKAAFLDLWRGDKVNKAERAEKREKRKDQGIDFRKEFKLRNYKERRRRRGMNHRRSLKISREEEKIILEEQ